MSDQDIFEKLVTHASRLGMEVLDRGNGHWQVRGASIVNYYPFSRKKTAFVNGTTKGFYLQTWSDVIDLAKGSGPGPKLEKTERKGTGWHKRAKARLLRWKDPICDWCDQRFDPERLTVDHKIPLSRGGSNLDDNLVLACHPCNHDRGATMPKLNTKESLKNKRAREAKNG